MEQRPISLYVHIPWCVKKCPYCDFNSHVHKDGLPEQDYIQALIAQLQSELPRFANRPIQSIFFGGGTPSLFSAQAISVLLKFVHMHCKVMPDCEITLEANPGTVEQQRFQSYFDIGINRISLGIQSFQDQYLEKIGRIHGASEAKNAIDMVRLAGFTNFNIDIMYGLPAQSIEDAIKDIETALTFAPPHLSWYQLTLEPNTHFYKRPPVLPKEAVIIAMEEAGRAALYTHGLKRYEISAYSKEKRSIHNLNYWQFGDYIGIGAGAHGKVTDIKHRSITRTACVKNPKQYMRHESGFYAENTTVAQDELPFEYMLNVLRLIDGTPTADFTAHTFLSINEIEIPLRKALDLQLIEPFEKTIKPTEKGLTYLNDLTLLFLPATETDV